MRQVFTVPETGVINRTRFLRSGPAVILWFPVAVLFAGSLIALIEVVVPNIHAQMNMGSHAMEMRDEIPPDHLPPPAHIAGIGNAHLRITATPEAQTWFDQGLNLLHDFWDYESARAFEQAVRVDPRCAMCFWGLYQAESFYHSTAKGLAGAALRQAAALKDGVSERERLYIDAAVAHNQATHSSNPDAYFNEEREALKKIVSEYPDDLQAKIFLADAGGQSLDVLEAVLKDHPEDSAANHHYIHLLEASEHPERALHSAEILGRLAPGSGHMVHMPGHIFFRLGDYSRAEKAFAESLEVDERYMREQHVDPDNDWNYVHNLMYYVADLLEEGKLDQAEAISAKVPGARGELETTLYITATRDSISRLDPRLPLALRTADFPRVLELIGVSAVRPGMPNLEFLRERLRDFASAMDLLEQGKLEAAAQMAERLDAEVHRMTQTNRGPAFSPAPVVGEPPKLAVKPDAQLYPVLRTLSIMSLEARASLSTAQGRIEEAKALFARAAGEEKALGYREPPNYIRPVGETEGAAMIRARRWSDARAAFERALLERPHSGFALYGIATANEKAGDSGAALKSYAEFLSAWKDADAGLPQIAHAREYLRAR